MALGGIPLKIAGVHVGVALINDDGTIEISVDGPCQFGKDLLQLFRVGDFDSLTLVPTGFPVRPSPAKNG